MHPLRDRPRDLAAKVLQALTEAQLLEAILADGVQPVHDLPPSARKPSSCWAPYLDGVRRVQELTLRAKDVLSKAVLQEVLSMMSTMHPRLSLRLQRRLRCCVCGSRCVWCVCCATAPARLLRPQRRLRCCACAQLVL